MAVTPVEGRVMQLEKRLDITRRDAASYQEDWQVTREDWRVPHERAMSCRDWEVVAEKGLVCLRRIVSVNEVTRDLLARAEADYLPALDATLFALLWEWHRVSALVVGEIEELERDGYQVEHAESFRRSLAATGSHLRGLDLLAELPQWQDFLGRSRLWAESNFPAERLATTWDGIDVNEFVRRLRVRNLQARGLEADEVAQLSDLQSFPGTLYGESLEWHHHEAA